MKAIKNLTITLFIIFSSNIFSQDGISYSLSADIVSKYIWRGIEISENPNFQTNLCLSYTKNWGAVEFGLWSSLTFNEAFSEADFYLKYSYLTENIGKFSLCLYDYYYPFNDKEFNDFSGDGEGAHTLDLIFDYEGPKSFPITFQFSKILYNNFPDNGSIYLELGYLWDLESFSFKFLTSAAEGRSLTYLIDSEKFQINSIGLNFNTQLSFSESFNLPVDFGFHRNLNLDKNFFYLVFSF